MGRGSLQPSRREGARVPPFEIVISRPIDPVPDSARVSPRPERREESSRGQYHRQCSTAERASLVHENRQHFQRRLSEAIRSSDDEVVVAGPR